MSVNNLNIFKSCRLGSILILSILTPSIFTCAQAASIANQDLGSASKLGVPNKKTIKPNNLKNLKKDIQIKKPAKLKPIIKKDAQPIIKRVSIPKKSIAGESFKIQVELTDDVKLNKLVVDIAGKKDVIRLNGKSSEKKLLTLKRNKPGKHRVTILVFDSNNQQSKPYTSSILLEKPNNAPKIVELSAPKSIRKGDEIAVRVLATDDGGLKQLIIKVNNIRRIHTLRGKKATKSLKFKSRGSKSTKIEVYAVDNKNVKSEVVKHTVIFDKDTKLAGSSQKSFGTGSSDLGGTLNVDVFKQKVTPNKSLSTTAKTKDNQSLKLKKSLSLKKNGDGATTDNTSISTLNKPDIQQRSNTGLLGSAVKKLKKSPATNSAKLAVTPGLGSSLSVAKNTTLKTGVGVNLGKYAYRDPATGNSIAGSTLLLLPNGKRLMASQYYAELERMDKAVTASGLTSLLRSSRVQSLPQKPLQIQVSANSNLQRVNPRDFSVLPTVSNATISQISQSQVNCDAILDDGIKTIAEREACENVRTYAQGEANRERQRQQVKEVGRRTPPAVRRSVGIKGILWGEMGYRTRVYGASNYYGDNSASNVELSIFSNADILGEDFSLLDGGCTFERTSSGTDKKTIWLSVGGKDVGERHTVSERFDVVIPLAGIDIVGSFIVSGNVGIRSSQNRNSGVGYLDVSCEPYANTAMTVEGGISALIATAGLGADLKFLEVSLPLNAKVGFKQNGQQPQLIRQYTLAPTARMLDGDLYAFVDVYVPVFDYPPWEEKRIQWNIIDWGPLTLSGNVESADEVANLP